VGAIVELRLLGPVELIGPDGLVRLGGPHRRAIVAQLALHAGQTVSTDELVEGLWADAAPASARKSLSTQVAKVRRPLAEIGARLDHTGGGYRLDLPPGHLDLHRFEQAERAASELAAAGHTTRAIEHLRDGLACWHGAPLADLVRFPFAATAASWLLPRHHATQDRLAELLLGAGEPDEAALLLERLVEESPYDERRWAQLVRALSAGGRRRDALHAYQRARAQLGEGLGLDPGRELRDVERDVLAGATSGKVPVEPRRGPAPFVGRTVELDRLDHAVDRTERGVTQMVAVLGEPGIGKTRLLTEFVRRVRGRGITALMGGSEPSQSVPLQSLLAALDPLLADPVTPGAPGIDPDLLHLLHGPATAPSLVEPTGLDLRRFRVIRALSRTIANLAVPGPLVLVLDDAHWLDPFTAAVLDDVCETDADRRVLIVAGASTAPTTWAALEERFVRFERSIPLERLRLRPLSSAELQALIRGHAVGVDDVDLLAEQIHEASGGNALFATQLARAAAPTGRLPTAVPDGLDAMCRSRVAVISAPARALLEAASVLGIDVDLALVAALLDASVEDTDQRVHEVVAAGLVTEAEQTDHLRFAHGVVRQVVYDDLAPGRRRRLHAEAADALDRVSSRDDPNVVTAVAHHLRHARPLVSDDRVRAALVAAGQQAANRGALEAGRTLLEEALALAGTALDRAAIEIASGIIGLATGDRAAAKQIADAATVARAHGRWDLVADAAITQAQLQSSPSPGRSRSLAADLEEIVAHLRDHDPTRCSLLQSWRAYLLVNVDPERSQEAVDAADALAPATPNLQLSVATRYVRLRQAEARGEDPVACVRDALELATDTVLAGEPGLASYGHVACQAARLRAGLFDDCREDQPRYLRHAIDSHQRAIELQLVAVDVALQLATGTVQEAEAASIALVERLGGAGVESAPAVRFIQQLITERESDAGPGWVAALKQVAARPFRGTEPILAAGLAAAGEVSTAREVISPFLGELGGLPHDWSHDALVALAAEVVGDLQLNGPHVEQLYQALLPASTQVVTLTSVVLVLGRADRYLGRLARLAGDADRAIEHLTTARHLDDAAGSGLWAGWAAHDEAVVRLERGEPGDEEAAAELLDLALARARRHGSKRLTRAASV
jgi:DNA-binding SARP family transcriptional activator